MKASQRVQGELEIKKKISLGFSAVISDSPFVEFCMIAEGISLKNICELLEISKDFDSLEEQVGFKDIELKGLFVTAERNEDQSSLFKRVTSFGVRLHVIFESCRFEVDTHFTQWPKKETECSLTLLPGGKIHLLELMSKHGIPLDNSFNKEKDLVLTELKIVFKLPSKDWTLAFQVNEVFEFEIFERKLSCSHLKGEILIADGTKSVHLQIAFLLGDASAILDACYDDGNWSVSVDYVGDVETKDLKWLAGEASKIEDLHGSVIKSGKNYISLRSCYLELSRINGKLRFAGSCLTTFGFNIPFIDAEVEGQAYLALEKAKGDPCKFTVIAKEIKLDLNETNLKMTATLGVEWESKDIFRVYLADCQTESNQKLSEFCKEIDADLKFSDEIKKYPLEIRKVEFDKTEAEWKMKMDLKFGEINLVSEVFKLRQQNSLEINYLFCCSIRSLNENLLQALEQDEIPKALLSAEAKFTNTKVTFMKKIIFALQSSLKVDFTILDLNGRDEGKVILKELNCSFVRIQDHNKLESLAWKDKFDSSLPGQIIELKKFKKKWSLILDGEVEIFKMKCRIIVDIMEGGDLVCKGQVVPSNFSLFEWLKYFEEEEDDFKEVWESVMVIAARVEVYSERKYVKFYCQTSIGNIEVHFYKADGSNKSGVKVFTSKDLILLPDLPFPLDDIAFVYANRDNKSLCIKKERTLRGKLSFVKCTAVKPFYDLIKEVIPRFPTELMVGLNLKEKTLVVTEGIQWDFRLGDLLQMRINSLEFKAEKVFIDSKINFPIFENLELEGRVSFDRSRGKIEGKIGVKGLNRKFFSKLMIDEAGINGVIYPISTGFGFFTKGTIQGYNGEFEISVGPGTPLPFFNLAFPENFQVCLSSIVDVFLGVKIPKSFDLVKIKPRNGSKRVEVRFMSLMDIKADFMLELFGFFQAEFYLEIGLQGIEAKINLNKLSLLGGLIELTDSKTDKGPLAHLCIKPFSNQYFFKTDCRIKIFGLEAAAYIDLSTEGLEAKIPFKLDLGQSFGVSNEFHLVLKPGKEILLANHFCFKLNFSLPSFSIFGLKFPEIELVDSQIDFDLRLDTNKFSIYGSFQFAVLGKAGLGVEFKKLELEFCKIWELPLKVGLCLAKNIGGILLELGEVFSKNLFQMILGVDPSVLMNPTGALANVVVSSIGNDPAGTLVMITKPGPVFMNPVGALTDFLMK